MSKSLSVLVMDESPDRAALLLRQLRDAGLVVDGDERPADRRDGGRERNRFSHGAAILQSWLPVPARRHDWETGQKRV